MKSQSESGVDIGAEWPKIYHIRCKGHLGSRWDDMFGSMMISAEAGGETLLIGPVVDQAALHGVLATIRDMGLTLISVSDIDPHQSSLAVPATRRPRKGIN